MPRAPRCAGLAALVGIGALAQHVREESIPVGHLRRNYFVQYPSGPEPVEGWPLVLSYHGWLSHAGEMASYDRFRYFGSSSAIVIHGEGYSDPVDPGQHIPADRWKSWNGAGSAGQEDGGVNGPICVPEAVGAGGWQCYKSCQAKGWCRGDGIGADRCRWSHCEDDVAFTLAIIDRMKSLMKVDTSRIFASGHSNGGLFVYELASDPRSSGVFSAIAPISGLPHNGFNRGSVNTRMRLLDIGGTEDTFVWHFPNVPDDGTKSYGNCCGWLYSTAANTTGLWAVQKGLDRGGLSPLRSPAAALECQGWSGDRTAIGAVSAFCFYKGGHQPPEDAFSAAWDFFHLARPAAGQPAKHEL